MRLFKQNETEPFAKKSYRWRKQRYRREQRLRECKKADQGEEDKFVAIFQRAKRQFANCTNQDYVVQSSLKAQRRVTIISTKRDRF